MTNEIMAAPAATAAMVLVNEQLLRQVEHVAELMASGRTTMPAHLRGNKGDCFAICLQAMQWRMNPISVGQKTFVVSGTLGYEAQLVSAVINNSGAVQDRFHFEWFGPWEKIIGKFKEVTSTKKMDDNGRPKKYIVPDWNSADEQGLGVKVWATIKGEREPRELILLLTQARTRNSTLWTEDPKQQLAYLAQKRWARLYAPDVILGVYTDDEMSEPTERFMGPAEEVKPPEPEVWTDEAWEKTLPKILAGIKKGKTIEQALAWLNGKAKVSPEREADLRKQAADLHKPAPQEASQASQASAEPRQTPAQAFTYAEVADRLNAAKDMEELAEVGSVISGVRQDQRAELVAIFEKRATELEGAPA